MRYQDKKTLNEVGETLGMTWSGAVQVYLDEFYRKGSIMVAIEKRM